MWFYAWTDFLCKDVMILHFCNTDISICRFFYTFFSVFFYFFDAKSFKNEKHTYLCNEKI